MPTAAVGYVLGAESSGKTDLVRQLEYLSSGKLRAVPTKCTSTTGQEISLLTLSPLRGKQVTMELRELGGSVVNTWESFIVARKAKDTAANSTSFVLVYVVDAAAPCQLPLSSTMLRYLTQGPEAACRGWRTLIVLQKCASVGAMTKTEAYEFFAEGRAREALYVVEADSWNGVGVGDVLKWLSETPFQ